MSGVEVPFALYLWLKSSETDWQANSLKKRLKINANLECNFNEVNKVYEIHWPSIRVCEQTSQRLPDSPGKSFVRAIIGHVERSTIA